MDTSRLEHFKKQLEGELKLVESELKSLGVKDASAPGGWEPKLGEFDDSATEPDELADRMEEMEENEDEIKEIQKHWNNIKKALGKIEGGSYGICEISGESIEEDRLEANPSARTCKAHMTEEGELPE